MRVIRITAYPPLEQEDDPECSAVLFESDLEEPFDVAIEKMTNPANGFIVFEVFEMPNGTSIEKAGKEAERRQQARFNIEKDMAVFFYYTAKHLHFMEETGEMLDEKPAPIPATDLVYCMKQLARLPWYKSQTVKVSSGIDGKYVQMAEGHPMIAGKRKHHHSEGPVN